LAYQNQGVPVEAEDRETVEGEMGPDQAHDVEAAAEEEGSLKIY
jgi:hypothetical protein